ncbi:protein PLANT CADMIUM RESISTANCE 7-like [Rutidosis leptorrhynchoides]|uniref:protein PLANT CADMIUM RESISTANCE 7-like n=1 Tax=Rutidosis leptorrhynchoides TaxID=125765 RepID=UPI003A9A39AF
MYPSSQPMPQHATGDSAHHFTTPSEWSTGLFDCDNDYYNCCLTCWCPCITFGQIAEVVDKGTTSCIAHGAIYSLLCLFTGGCQCIYACMQRSKLRQQYMLPEQPCNDCLTHCFCEMCAICQEYRELQYRGLDPSLGWDGNISRQNQGVVMPPINPGEMKR